MHAEAGELPLKLRKEKLALQYALKLRANKLNPTYLKAFQVKNTELYNRKLSAIRPFSLRVKEHLKILCPDLNNIEDYNTPKIPPWTLDRPLIDLSLTKFPKASIDPLVFQNLFGELRDKYNDYRDIYTDGSKDDNKVAAAAVTKDLNIQVRLSNCASIFTAELRAILHALDIVSSYDDMSFIIFSDSLSCLYALQGNNFDNPDVLKILERCHELIDSGKNVVFAWCPSHVGIKGNERADKLAKEALGHNVFATKIPYTDLKPRIYNLIFSKWQNQWDEEPNNKLYKIKPKVRQVYPHSSRCSRREEVVLARARIGHTYITHSFLLKGEQAPACNTCAVPLTVEHILIDCSDYAISRNKYFNVTTLNELFAKVNASSIIDFLKDIRLFYKF